MDEHDFDPKLQALFQKVREKELNPNKGKVDKDNKNNNQNGTQKYRWVKIAVYLWAARLGLSIFGGSIPALFAWFNWQTNPQKHNSNASTSSNNPTSMMIIPSHDWVTLLKDNFLFLSQMKSSYSPHIIHNVSVISTETIQLLSQTLVKSWNNLQIKVSTDPIFAYFTPDRPWSTYLQPSYQYISLKDFISNERKLQFKSYSFLDLMKSHADSSMTTSDSCASNGVDSQQPQECSTKEHYLYLSYPRLKPFLESFAPSMTLIAKYFHHVPKDIDASLWMASENVSAVMHYDLEDNLLLQISGTKEVVIASPEAVTIVKPYSSLHPLWRQSSIKDLLTYERLMELHQQHVEETKLDAELQELQRKLAKAKEKKKLHKNHQLLTGKDSKVEEEDDDENGITASSSNDYMTFSSWKITLQPGDMIFIPAGFYHAVVTGKESVSVNAWFPSELSAIHERFSSIPLPFYANDNPSVKVADVVTILRQVCTLLGKESDCFAKAFRLHYSDDIMGPLLSSVSCPTPVAQEYCTDTNIQSAEKKGGNRRVSNAIYANIQKARLGDALQTQAVVEYIEEVLLLIFKEELSPCKMEQILRECWY